MGLLEIVVVLLLALIVGTAFVYSRKAEKITKEKAEQRRIEEEQARGAKKK